MKILVCIKNIVKSDIEIDDAGRWVQPRGMEERGMSRFDENALEAAMEIKDIFSRGYRFDENRISKISGMGQYLKDVTVDVLSMGSHHALASIRRGMGMGADLGIHLVTGDGVGYVPGIVTASSIAALIDLLKKEHPCKTPGGLFEYDLILAGVMSEDMMQAQVGPMLASFLDIPCITSVVEISLNPDWQLPMDARAGSWGQDNHGAMDITVQRELEGGFRQEVSANFPILLTIQAGINQPRYPSLSNVLKAGKKKILSYNINDLSPYHEEGKTSLVSFEYPVKKREGIMLEGTREQKADKLAAILMDRGLV
ncbi:MAG: electron transfer flavoprotein subunit beta/FixA family protein [Desulfamplus sp.]|nr:electron transfer flavoprotein subunit beta/FixA family protein [Desulfamplus sp.]